MTNLTFEKPVRLYTGSSFGLTQSAEFFRKRPNGNQKDFAVTLPFYNAGLGFMDEYIYVVDFFNTRIWRWNILDDTGGNWLITPFDDPDDCACDGAYVYLSGADTSEGSLFYRVAKFDVDANQIWHKELGAYSGGAIHIAANSDGFMLVSNNAIRIYDGEGAQIANRDSYINNNSSFQWASSATRDRYFVADKTASSGGDVQIHEFVSSTGAFVQTIEPTDLAVDEAGKLSVTEDHLFYWTDPGTLGRTNNHVRIYDRTVIRDDNGDITSDTFASTGTNYDLGVATTNDFTKAATNARTYTDY